MSLFQITHYTNPNYTDHPQVNINWIHCTENFFTVRGSWETLRLPWKTELPWIHCIEFTIFIIQNFWATCACPEKQRLPWKFLLYWIYFSHSGFLSNLRLPWKTVCLEFTVLNLHFLSFRIFEQLALALKNRVCPVNFHYIENIFYHSGFLSNFRLALKNRVSPEFTVLNICFLSFRIFEQLALALKNRVALKFFTILKYFSSFRIFEQVALALKTQLTLKLFQAGGLPPTRPSASYAYVRCYFSALDCESLRRLIYKQQCWVSCEWTWRVRACPGSFPQCLDCGPSQRWLSGSFGCRSSS